MDMIRKPFGSFGPSELPGGGGEQPPEERIEETELPLNEEEISGLESIGVTKEEIGVMDPATARETLRMIAWKPGPSRETPPAEGKPLRDLPPIEPREEKPLHDLPPIEPPPERPSEEEVDRKFREKEGIPSKTETQPEQIPEPRPLTEAEIEKLRNLGASEKSIDYSKRNPDDARDTILRREEELRRNVPPEITIPPAPKSEENRMAAENEAREREKARRRIEAKDKEKREAEERARLKAEKEAESKAKKEAEAALKKAAAEQKERDKKENAEKERAAKEQRDKEKAERKKRKEAEKKAEREAKEKREARIKAAEKEIKEKKEKEKKEKAERERAEKEAKKKAKQEARGITIKGYAKAVGAGLRGAKEGWQEKRVERKGKPLTATERQEKTFLDLEKQFGIKREELESVEGWNKLSPGQQALVLENLRQVTLGRIQEEGLARTQKETAEAKFLGRVWHGFFKRYYAVKAEKATAEEIMGGGMETHGKVLEQLVGGMAKMGPNVEVNENGELEIQYARLINATPEQKEIIDNFNRIATEFSKTPFRWSESFASKNEREKFQKQREAYEEAKKELVEMLVRENSDTEEFYAFAMMEVVSGVDQRVRLSQFLNTCPEAEKEIQKIQSKWAWVKAANSVVAERGGYMALGYVTRALTISMFGLIGAPLAAAGIGSWMARKRTAEALTESARAKKEMGKEREEILTFTSAENLSRKINEIIDGIRSFGAPESEEEREKTTDLLLKLKARADYTWRQLNMGLVNFGGSDNKTANQYELLQSLAEAEVMLRALEDEETENKLLDRLNSFMGVRQERMGARYKKQLRDQMIRGAIMGAGFATLGYAIRHLFWGGQDMSDADLRPAQTPTETPPGAPAETAGTGVPADTVEIGGARPGTTGVGEAPGPLPQGVPGTEEIIMPTVPTMFEVAAGDDAGGYVETVGAGGSVWRAAEDQLEKHFGKAFANLNEGQRTYIIDALKDKIVANPEKYGLTGITDPDQIPVGAKIDFSELIKDGGEMEKIFGKAGVLSEAQVDNIVRNNEVLRTWVEEHPGEKLSSGKVEEILRGGAPETAATETIPAETVPAETVAGTAGAEQVTGVTPAEAVQEIIAGERKGEFIIPESGFLHNARVRFTYDSRTGLPIGHTVRGVLFGFNPEDKLKDGWFETMSERLDITTGRGLTAQDDYLFSRVRNLEIIERINDKMPKNTPEARYLGMITDVTRRAVTERFGDVLKF